MIWTVIIIYAGEICVGFFLEAVLNANMKNNVLQEIIIALLVILFVYAGSSKLWDMKSFRTAMTVQPFPLWMNKGLATVLPFSEIIIAMGLGFDKTRKGALYAYALLMSGFTIYTGLVVFGFFEHEPCGCGGIISQLSWEWHFIINVLFLILTCLAIRLDSHKEIFMHKQGVS